MTNDEYLTATIPSDLAGMRFDQALASLFPRYSRARFQEWIRTGQARLDGRQVRPRERVHGGQEVRCRPAATDAGPAWAAEPMPLSPVYDDADIIVIDKPPGLVVHPGAGNPSGTLVNALLDLDPALSQVPRCGVVHRIDKDTSGLLVVARNLRAHKHLVDQLQGRTMHRAYQAVALGVMTAGGEVSAPIGRHRVHRTRMAVTAGGKPATTHYRVEERFAAHTLLCARLDTGRTHQIRVHMAHIGHPLVGDPVYGGRLRLPPGADEDLAETLRGFRRQALHARRLELAHPADDRPLAFESPLPADMAHLIERLRAHVRAG